MRKQVGVHLGWLALAVLTVAGCGGGSQSQVHPMAIASDAGSQALAQFDANRDGSLDYGELDKAPGLKDAVAKIKKMANFRGAAPSANELKAAKISAEEIDARIQEWKSQGTGRITVSCRVSRIGKRTGTPGPQPIEGAEVKLVPEGFLGTDLTVGVGKTDANGIAMVSQPSRGGNDPDRGMSPGFYRVEITKGGEIPAKYNSATTLGLEVAGDAVRLSTGGPTFDLEY